jgi:hypothetical protein
VRNYASQYVLNVSLKEYSMLLFIAEGISFLKKEECEQET